QAIVDGLDRDTKNQIILPGELASSGTTVGQVMNAISDPKNFRDSLQQEIELARVENSQGRKLEGLMRQISEKEAALRVADFVEPYAGTMAKLLSLAFRIPNSERQPVLKNFFREMDVMDRLSWDISERITKRFIARFSYIGQSSPGYTYADAMMNTISEYTMVSLGIIDPNLFVRLRGEARTLDVLFASQNVDDQTNGAVNLEAEQRKLSLKASGTIFWSRWSVNGKKPSLQTDNAIRRVMTEVIRGDKEQTLEAFEFPKFFNELKEIRKTNEKDNVKPLFGQLLGDFLLGENFQKHIKARCTTSWYPALQQFWKA
ncbi:MAG: hypothetical protein KDD62_08030, partial [Bdellovibrionales bacterium]|nr:hypothetical protein [Bdellovibrionales bacterium]